MLNVSRSLSDVAVLRGGNIAFKESLLDGGEVLSSLSKIGYTPVDVLIEKDGSWNRNGSPTDPHTIFTQAHTIVDTTYMKNEPYQKLAKKMGISLIFSSDNEVHMDREDLYRILRQQNIKVPETKVIRTTTPLKDSLFREIWTKFHTPILIRPLHRHKDVSSKIIRIFNDLEKSVRDYHKQGIDVHILTYRNKHTTSISVLPHFRNEEVYTPLWVDTFPENGDLPNKDSRSSPHLQAPDFKKEHIKKIAVNVYKALGVNKPVCIDFINHNNDYIVVNVDLSPSLRKDSRFMKSLSTTGVDTGHYVHECIKNDIE